MERGKWHPPLFLQWSRVLTKGLKKNCETSLRLKKKKKWKIECRTGKKKSQKENANVSINFPAALRNGQE